ncbi:glutamate--cysteine ligase [Dactylosporangium sp. NPDC051541]|uniref:glutamate--cysteine ligase n=1 Tax=Dactylosporangium sp. NPDC051541 TaxID=3363977 RepID=UPI0037B2872C
MGQDVTRGAFSREDRARYRRKVRRCLDVFALMLNDFRFDSDRPTTGLEIEVNLIDPDAQPAMRNAEVLADLADPSFQTELGQFNLEINVAPRVIEGDGLDVYEREVLASLVHADERARKSDARLVLIGILPTLRPEHLVLANMSNDPRYRLLNDQIINARGEDMALDIRGHERLEAQSDSIAGESACTSVQFHLQVAPEDFARHWNASQAIAGIQVAVGANSPFLFGKRLWAETRIALFEQATDTRPEELKAQGVRPRVWFGERWITSIFDLFEENVRYFPPLLPITEEEDPVAVLEAGGVPRLGELRLHNGTIYRWNRPVYDIMNGRPHLRVENRVLPAGPTVVDQLANAAFYFGLVRELCEQDRPVWTQMSFSAAEENFHLAAREGLDAQVWWPEVGETPVGTLVLDELLPLAAAGLDRFGVQATTRDRLLGVIEGRCQTGQNGAAWQTRVVQHLEEHHNLDRTTALQKMLQRYSEGLHENVPVHTWPT